MSAAPPVDTDGDTAPVGLSITAARPAGGVSSYEPKRPAAACSGRRSTATPTPAVTIPTLASSDRRELGACGISTATPDAWVPFGFTGGLLRFTGRPPWPPRLPLPENSN